MAALGQVWACLPWVPLVPQPRYLWPGNWGDWKPLHVLQATLQYMKAELCHLLTWQQALQKAQAKWGVEAGKLMTWKASLCGVQKINLQKGSRIPAARAVPGDALPRALQGVHDTLPQSPGEGCWLPLAQVLLTLAYTFSSNILYFTSALYFFFFSLH